jgi:hypothetical protein
MIAVVERVPVDVTIELAALDAALDATLEEGVPADITIELDVSAVVEGVELPTSCLFEDGPSSRSSSLSLFLKEVTSFSAIELVLATCCFFWEVPSSASSSRSLFLAVTALVINELVIISILSIPFYMYQQ